MPQFPAPMSWAGGYAYSVGCGWGEGRCAGGWDDWPGAGDREYKAVTKLWHQTEAHSMKLTEV